MGTCGWAGSCRSQPRDGKWTSLSTEKPTHEAPRILWERIHAGALGVELCLVLVNGAFYRDSNVVEPLICAASPQLATIPALT